MDHLHERRGTGVAEPLHEPQQSPGSIVYQAFNMDSALGTVEVRRHQALLFVYDRNDGEAVFRLRSDTAACHIEIVELSASASVRWRLASAAFEYLFSITPPLKAILLEEEPWRDILPDLCRNGIAVAWDASSGRGVIHADMFWQTPALWSPTRNAAFPRREVYDGKIAHPLRPSKPVGTVYARFIPWLQGVLSFDVATLDDLPEVHRWMNDPRVNEFWNEAGDEDKHRRYLQTMFADPHIMPLIGRFNGKAFSYFEVYWAKEDMIGTFCDAADYDRGCHVIVGEEACRGQSWFTAWLPSLVHYAFLDDPRTERLVQEPSVLHHRQLRNLQRSGFAYLKSVDLPVKRAAIMSISRSRFFADQLWIPDGMSFR